MITYRFLVFAIFFAIGSADLDESSPVVTIEQGKIRGFKASSTKGSPFLSFLGIPYAEPPIGNLQFKDPVRHKGWEGELDGTQKASPCSQFKLSLFLQKKVVQYLGDPDCLIVNVHTSKLGSADLSVMVFFHGGLYISGSANNYAPDELLNEEIILVTVNYRLGIQGFLSTGDDVISGNFGLKDQRLALLWVRQNIEKFGGDPNKVTIFGQSAGAGSAHFHILSEGSQGLFTRAILQAGSLICPWAKTSDVRSTALKIGNRFNCFEGQTSLEGEAQSRHLLECLKKIDERILTDSLQYLFDWGWFPLLLGPHVDGNFIPEEPETLMRKANGRQVDVIFGVNRDEGACITNCFLAHDEQRRVIVDEFSSVGPLLLGLVNEYDALGMSRQAYQQFVGGIKNDERDFDNLNKMFGDRHFSVCTDYAASFQAKTNEGSNKKVYYYEFHHRGQGSDSDIFNVTHGKHWVSHADELLYLFPMKNFGFGERPQEDKMVRDIFVKTWTSFAKTGNPTPDNSLGFQWEEFSQESPKHLTIQPRPIMEEDSRREVREFWASLPTTQNKLLFGDTGASPKKDEF